MPPILFLLCLPSPPIPYLFHVSFCLHSVLFHLSRSLFRSLWHISLSLLPSFTHSSPSSKCTGRRRLPRALFCFAPHTKNHILLGPIGAWNPTSFPSNWTLFTKKNNPPPPSLLYHPHSFFPFPPLPLSKQPHNKPVELLPFLNF